MSYAVGYGSEVWTAGNYYFWVWPAFLIWVTDANRHDQVPMIAPFLGCAFGAALYDIFIFTGPSPINTPWMGLKILNPANARRARREHLQREKDEGIV